MWCTGNPSTQEAKAKGSRVQHQPGLRGETVSKHQKKKKDLKGYYQFHSTEATPTVVFFSLQ